MKKKVLVTGGSGFIGTNLVELLLNKGFDVINIDISEPMLNSHKCYWRNINILDSDALNHVVSNIAPEYVIDLVARTDVVETETVESGYQLNIDGVKNIIEAVNNCGSIVKVIFTSTQYVCRPGRIPNRDTYYDPHTVYGQSKVRMEELIRGSKIWPVWTIIRPTNVWGPWHFRYRDQFFKVLKAGYYIHPSGKNTVKSYAYVGNVVDQICRILEADADVVNRATFYVGDEPLALLEWVNAFSLALKGKPVRAVPRPLLYALATIGDFISAISQKPFLINRSRYKSMTENYLTPMDKTFDALGKPSYSLEDGVKLTLEWIDAYSDLSPAVRQ